MSILVEKLLLVSILYRVVTSQSCETESINDRIDCFPDRGANENGCLSRGCCWQPTSNGATVRANVPFCYFPTPYKGYELVNQSVTKNSVVFYFERNLPSLIGSDIKLLKVETIYLTPNIIRIRIQDAEKARWEPPLPKIPVSKSTVTTDHSWNLSKEGNLNVYRGHGTDRSLLSTFGLENLIFTDRFQQLSIKMPSDVVYGLGEHKGSLRRDTNFKRYTFYNEDRIPSIDSRLYGTQPFLINIVDRNATGFWLFNSNAMDVILNPKPAITFRTVGGIFDLFTFLGPSPPDVVRQYQDMVGKPAMVPYWSLGFHLCRFGYQSTEDTKRILQKNLDAGIRVDVQWNDIDYMDKRNGFTLDPKNYGNLGGFVKELHDGGRHYVMIVDPAVSGSEEPGKYPPFDRGLDYDIFVKDLSGRIVKARVWNYKSSVFPDFTHPNASKYWTELFGDFHKNVSFDGAWIDMNEPSNMLDGHIDEGCPLDFDLPYTPGDEPLQRKTLCLTDQHYWSSHFNVHNMYGFTEAIATYKALETIRPNKRPFIISRSTFSGHGVYAGHWTGDVISSWTDLRDSVSGFLEFSFYGIPMVGVDICGFNGNTTEELCARWQALGAFYPFSRNHNTDDGIPQDPASMGEQVINVTKNAYYWRYKLLPHLYTLFYRAHVDGDTVARPLFFENLDDKNTLDIDEQFLWGSALMVVPALYKSQETINAYFPKGIWYDLQNRTAKIDTTTEGKFITIPAFNDTINFFMKGGHAVFFQEPLKTTTDSRQQPYGLYVFLEDGKAGGELFIDDGESIDSIAKNDYLLVTVQVDNQKMVIGTVDARDTKVVLDTVHIYGVMKEPHGVELNSEDFGDFVFDKEKNLLTLYNLKSKLEFIVIMWVD